MSPHDAHARRPIEIAATVPPPDGEGCLEILADRLRDWPGVIAIEADFRASTLSVRYQPSLVSLDELNAFADDVGSVFAQRVTTCEKRDRLDACSECALRFGRLHAEDAAQLEATARHGFVRLARRTPAEEGVEIVRPLSEKPWGAPFTPEEEEEHSEGRAMIALTVTCLVALLLGIVAERLHAPAWMAPALFLASAVTGGWFATQSTIAALAEAKFDVNLLMILAAAGAAAIGYILEAAVLMFLFSLSNTLEVYTMGRTRHALKALMQLRPIV
jgi:Cd2+/Zn2+-exporting ATPase